MILEFTNYLGFETNIGNVNVKSSPVYFYAQRSTSTTSTGAPIHFSLAPLNTGNALNIGTGKFIAPRAGTYFFSFTGCAQIGTGISVSGSLVRVGLYLNNKKIAQGMNEVGANALYVGIQTFSVQSTLQLNSNDVIWVQIDELSGNVKPILFDDANHSTHFTGWLLEENISNSVINFLG